jgi:effector-binding domain-containing protein
MKKILYILIGLVVLYVILCLCGPSSVKVERSIQINVSADVVRSKIVDLKFFHESWSPWTEKDPDMTVTYSGETGKEGSSMSWVSDKKEVGKGTMTYKGMHGDTIVESLYFDGQGEAQVFHIVSAEGTGSKVSWVMQNAVPFPFRAIMLFMNMDKMVGPDFEKGLAKLKSVLEAMPVAKTYDINELEWDAKTYYGQGDKLRFNEVAAFFGINYPKIGEELAKAKVKPIGQPKAIYFTFDEKTMVTDVAAVMEVPNKAKVANFQKFETPASKVLHVEYYGDYGKSIDAHNAIANYMKEKGLTQNVVIEEYVTDPMMEKDTAKWLTNIFYLVK